MAAREAREDHQAQVSDQEVVEQVEAPAEPQVAQEKLQRARDERGQFVAQEKRNEEKALAAAMRHLGQNTDAEGAQAAADGKAKGKEPAAETAAPTKPQAGEAEKLDGAAKKRAADLESARTHLKLAQFEDSDLEGLSEDQILRLGAKAKARNDSINKRFGQDASKDPKQAVPDGKTGEQAAATASPTSVYDQVAQRFAEYDDGGEFGQKLASVLKEVLSPLELSAKSAAEETARVRELAANLMMEKTASKLRERFTQLDQPDGLGKLRQRMVSLYTEDESRYGSQEELAQAAAESLWMKEVLEAEHTKAEAAAKRRAVLNGQPGNGRDVKPIKPKHYDIDAAALAAVEGKPIREAYNPKT